MACCVAIALFFGTIRACWLWVTGRDGLGGAPFAPGASRPAPGLPSPKRSMEGPQASAPEPERGRGLAKVALFLRAMAGTVFAYLGVLTALALLGWLWLDLDSELVRMRTLSLAMLGAIALLGASALPVPPQRRLELRAHAAPLLLGVGATGFELLVLDREVFGLLGASKCSCCAYGETIFQGIAVATGLSAALFIAARMEWPIRRKGARG